MSWLRLCALQPREQSSQKETSISFRARLLTEIGFIQQSDILPGSATQNDACIGTADRSQETWCSEAIPPYTLPDRSRKWAFLVSGPPTLRRSRNIRPKFPLGGETKMVTVSRRGLLHMSCGTAGALGISALTTELGAVTTPAQSKPVSNAGNPQTAAPPAESGTEMFYRDDWLGAPWVKPEVALLIHGNDESSISWFGWIPRMAQEFRLLRPDLPGFGNSSIPQNFEWSMPNLAATLARFLDHLGVESAHIIGAKTGGAIGMQFAADYPQRTRTLTIVSGPVTRVDARLPFSAPSSSSQQRRLGSSASKELVEYWDALMGSTRPETKTGIAKVEAALNMESVLPRIAAPTLVITSDRSALQSVETVLHYQQKIQNSRLLVLPSDGYHLAVIKPDECVSSVLTFIKEVKRNT